ncbi:MAG: glycoside hydrolase TIM-barrel-like domain-containing protein [bacterium]
MSKYLIPIFLLAISTPHHESVESGSKQRGVSWVGSGVVAEDDFLPLVENHVDWIAQTPFGWQQDYNSPTFELVRGRRVLWGERDKGIELTTRLAKKFGIKTLLKPHIWLRNRSDGKWRSDIEMDSEADWQSWFENYRRFILHYARLAEKNGIEALSVGTELHATIKQRPRDWQKIIAEVRKVYTGKLTYSANWYEEFEDVKFWDELDFIGIQAYFPLSDKHNPTIEELMAGWRSHLEAIEKVRKKYRKPVLFTEIGYKNTTDSAIKPWEWLRSSSDAASEAELQTQVNCYEAFFQTFWNKDWFAGSYIWKWFPKSRRQFRRVRDRFTPQNKPAEKVMAKWYGKAVD